MHGSNESSGIYSKQFKRHKIKRNVGSNDTDAGSVTSPALTAPKSDHFVVDSSAPPNISPVIDKLSNELSLLREDDPLTTSGLALTPFNAWDDYDFFSDLNQTSPFSPSHPTEEQLEFLMGSILPTSVPSPLVEVHNALTATGPRLLRVPSSDEIPIKGEHLGPPPPRNFGKRIEEAAFPSLVAQVDILNFKVISLKVGTDVAETAFH
jgi:hypothetical protein